MEIPINRELSRFKNHIQPKDNNKIILSGIFGIGKTTFIKEFFNKNSEFYTPFFINPVNYSIAQNEDILKLIKYDIIFEILKNGNVEYEFEKFSLSETNQFYIYKNYISLLRSIVKHFGKIGKSVSEILKDIQELKKDMIQFNSEYNKDEKAELLKFLEDISNESGSIYEEDTITQIISNIISKIETPPVLVIDDFDRLDPEHIFRLLNIFSCHLSTDYAFNKFGFHKIILVCDISNIEAIFSHKYGKKTDFVGYLDKFYSNEIFYLDTKIGFKQYIKRHIINFNNKLFNPATKELIITILQDLTELNLFNVRQLKEKVNDNFALIIKDKSFQVDGERYISGNAYGNFKDTNFCLAISFLSSLYGGSKSLTKILKDYNDSGFITKEKKPYFLYPVIDFLNLTINKTKEEKVVIPLNEYGLNVTTIYKKHYKFELESVEFEWIEEKYSEIDENKTKGNQKVKALKFIPYPKIIHKAFENFKDLAYWS
ncbi:P-loop NTPase fold protein [Tenacibaculum sp. nBUS_03]|uniref:P-loop NTPase fold protein n=1 Tax=Tenacibaculum sp. nBUS_03 TaxID=3395320 RepID=UPI003EB7B5F7